MLSHGWCGALLIVCHCFLFLFYFGFLANTYGTAPCRLSTLTTSGSRHNVRCSFCVCHIPLEALHTIRFLVRCVIIMAEADIQRDKVLRKPVFAQTFTRKKEKKKNKAEFMRCAWIRMDVCLLNPNWFTIVLERSNVWRRRRRPKCRVIDYYLQSIHVII